MPIPGITHSSGKIDWLTPSWLWMAAEHVMGGIDLDPCANSRDEPSVRAASYYTAQDDGLSKAWWGKVYLNPPWGRGIERWTEKALMEFEEGDVEQVVMALPASTETKWFAPLYRYTICFARGRCFFVDAATNEVPDKGGPTPVAYVYLGRNILKFSDTFKLFGNVVRRF